MKKKDLMRFIENERERAETEVRNKWDKQIREAKEETLIKYKSKIQEIANDIIKLNTNVANLIEEIKEDSNVNYQPGYYLSLERRLVSRGTEEQLLSDIIDSCYFRNEVSILQDKRQKEYEEVSTNYNNLYLNCKAMTKAKDIYNYLIELGFDLSNVEGASEITSICIPVDVTKLMIPKKQGE